jgi:hypothetical protein
MHLTSSKTPFFYIQFVVHKTSSYAPHLIHGPPPNTAAVSPIHSSHIQASSRARSSAAANPACFRISAPPAPTFGIKKTTNTLGQINLQLLCQLVSSVEFSVSHSMSNWLHKAGYNAPLQELRNGQYCTLAQCVRAPCGTAHTISCSTIPTLSSPPSNRSSPSQRPSSTQRPPSPWVWRRRRRRRRQIRVRRWGRLWTWWARRRGRWLWPR